MKTLISILAVSALTSFASCNYGYKPDISTTASPKGTNVFLPDSASIAASYKIPKWFEDAKFGIFIHWGVYSVPSFTSEWYARWMYKEGSPTYVIDFTRYDLPAHEPADPSPEHPIKDWSLMNVINQKGLREQDKPRQLNELNPKDQDLIKKFYPELFKQ